MLNISLPDGSIRSFDKLVSVAEVAASISTSLAKSTVAGVLDGKVVDTSHVIQANCELKLIREQDEEALEILRHTTAHLLAYAVKLLFPEAQVTIGPVIENGFYYDFSYSRAFTPEDLALIENKMREISKNSIQIERCEWARDEAIDYFLSIGEKYKAEIIGSIPQDQAISIYKMADFVDLCRGPHLPNVNRIKHFKLMKLAGAYWRGNSKNEMLQRVYGTCWFKKEDLDGYLSRIEEAERRDHRKLGQQLDFFHFQEEAPGSVFWHPKGWKIFQSLIGYMRNRQELAGYVEVNTPDVMDRSLWEISGHWQNYRDHMFTTQTEDERVFALKPMNCPGAVSLFKQGITSYRNLPLRMAEFGKVHRYEPSGALHGLMRVRHFTQDDAHIFCTVQQMQHECRETIKLVLDIYKYFGFEQVKIKLSTRPENRIGSDEIWDKLESALIVSLEEMNLKYALNPGEGAFYGPKLEFVLRDAIGRDWQCGTLQVDLNLPERFDINYITEENSKARPVMLHRALFGSLERFIGILIEHYAGALPFWLSPVQGVVMSISAEQTDYAIFVHEFLKKQGFRVELDLRNEKIGYKIRDHSLQRLPYQFIVGAKEKAEQVVAVRNRNGEDLGKFSYDELVNKLASESNPIATA